MEQENSRKDDRRYSLNLNFPQNQYESMQNKIATYFSNLYLGLIEIFCLNFIMKKVMAQHKNKFITPKNVIKTFTASSSVISEFKK